MGGIWYDSMNKVEPITSNGEPEAGYHLSDDEPPTTYGTSA